MVQIYMYQFQMQVIALYTLAVDKHPVQHGQMDLINNWATSWEPVYAICEQQRCIRAV